VAENCSLAEYLATAPIASEKILGLGQCIPGMKRRLSANYNKRPPFLPRPYMKYETYSVTLGCVLIKLQLSGLSRYKILLQ